MTKYGNDLQIIACLPGCLLLFVFALFQQLMKATGTGGIIAGIIIGIIICIWWASSRNSAPKQEEQPVVKDEREDRTIEVR